MTIVGEVRMANSWMRTLVEPLIRVLLEPLVRIAFLVTVGFLVWGIGLIVALDELRVQAITTHDVIANLVNYRVLPTYLFVGVFLVLWSHYASPRRTDGSTITKYAVGFIGVTLFAGVYSLGLHQSPVGIDWSFLTPLKQSGLAHLLLAIPSVAFFVISNSVKSATLEAPPEHAPGEAIRKKMHLSFLNQVFLPSVLYILSVFSMGLYASVPSLEAVADIYVAMVILSVCCGYFVFLFWRIVNGDPRFELYVLVFIALLLGSFITSVLTDATLAKFIGIALTLTFATGVARVAMLYSDIVARKYRGYDLEEHENFFLLGSNWSSVIFPVLGLTVLSAFEDFDYVPSAMVVSIFVVGWLHMDSSWKASKFGRWFAVAYGTLLPVSVAAGFTLTTSQNDWFSGNAGTSELVLALLAQVAFAVGLLRLAKDTVGVSLDSFFLNLWSADNYLLRPHCLFLLLTVNAVFVVLLLFLFVLALFRTTSVGDISTAIDLGRNLANAGFVITFISLVALMGTFGTPGSVRRLASERQKMKNDANQYDNNDCGNQDVDKQKSQVQTNWKYTLTTRRPNEREYALGYLLDCIRSGRLGVSWIAGLAAGTAVWSSGTNDLATAATVVLCMTLLTMFGFISNDISDIEKDRLALKSRPITTGRLPTNIATAFASSILLCVIFLSTLWGVAAAASAMFIAVALVYYSAFSAKYPLYKGLYTALLCITPFGFAAAITGEAPDVTLISVIFLFIVFREVLLDTLDAVGDRRYGLTTVVHVIGERNAKLIGWCGMFASLVLGQLFLTNIWSVGVLYLALGSLLVSRILYGSDEQLGLRSTRVAMLLGVFSIAIS